MTQIKTDNGQVRLIIPREWISQLDTVARSKFSSRMALLRHYIRWQLDKDLENLSEQLETYDRQRHTLSRFTELQSRFNGD